MHHQRIVLYTQSCVELDMTLFVVRFGMSRHAARGWYWHGIGHDVVCKYKKIHP